MRRMSNKVFRVVGCPYCKTIQVTSATKYLNCKICGKRTPINKLRIFYASRSALEASKIARQLKLRQRIRGSH